MTRVIVNQAVRPEDMTTQEPRQTKSLAFVSDRTNMYLIRMGGGVALLHTPTPYPGKAWDGMIFDKDSEKLIEGMILGLQFIQKNRKKLFGLDEPKPVKKADILFGKKKPRAKAKNVSV